MNLTTRRRVNYAGVLAGPVLWVTIFMFVPYAIMLTYSFYSREFPFIIPDFQFGNYLQLFADPQYYQVFVRTLKIAVLVTLGALVLAYPLTYFIVFKIRSPRLRMLIYASVIVPLWVSYLLRAYTWKTILGSQGVLNSFLIWAGILDQPSDLFLYNQFAMVLTLTYIFVPFMVMSIFASLEKIPVSLIEASKDLGVGRIRTFLSITLPLSVPGILAGGAITFGLTMGDFVAPFLVGGPDGALLATIMQTQFGTALNWPLGAAIAMVMMIVVLSIITLTDRAERAGRLDLG
ncbi:MAG: ABC transporter permease [Rhodospirillaceae bacterium]|nr:ABC transporter permease [Rhodospirillaceae bacterium]